MVIETLEKKYTVIRNLYSDRQMDRYVCKDGADGKNYAVTRIKEKESIVKIMDFLMQQMENHDFTDLAACFFKEEDLYIVMRYSEGMTLAEKLDVQECVLEERMEMMRKILDRLMLLRMPDFFMKDCLKAKTIIVSSGMDMEFQYGLQGIENYYAVQFQEVCDRLIELLQLLFKEELQKKTLPEIEKFIKDLKKGEYTDVLSVYSAYDKLHKEIGQMGSDELKLPRTWEFRAWGRVIRAWPVIKRVAALVALLAAIGFFIYTVHDSMLQGGEQKVFEYIGTLTIK